jgi:hypothetical protein
VEILRDLACAFACTRCCFCFCSNWCSLVVKLIPLCELEVPTSWFTSPSSEICDPLGMWCRIWEYVFPEDVSSTWSPLKEYEGTVFKRVRSILKAVLCCIHRANEKEILETIEKQQWPITIDALAASHEVRKHLCPNQFLTELFISLAVSRSNLYF